LFAIIDIETTGLDPKKDKITEIAIMVHDGLSVVERFATLINPERKYSGAYFTHHGHQRCHGKRCTEVF
jgi:DNA polymerase-3 subunit epsilon